MTSKRHTRWLAAELDDLVESGVLERDAALRVRNHYDEAAARRPGVPLFAVLGAGLTGLGIILLVAHNWEAFSRTLRLGIGFGILIAGQGAAAFAGFRRRDSVAWTEATALAASFAVAACLAIVSQVYQLPGDFGRFIQTWCWVSLPIAYALDARAAIALAFGLIGTRALELGFDRDPMLPAWALLGATLPYLVWLARRGVTGMRDSLVAWLAVPTLLVFAWIQVVWESGLLFGCLTVSVATGLYALGTSSDDRGPAPFARTPARVLGGLALATVLLVFCHDESWSWGHAHHQTWAELAPAIALAAAGILTALTRMPGVLRAGDLASGLVIASPLAFALAWVLGRMTDMDEAATWTLSLHVGVMAGALIVSGARSGAALRANFGMLLLGAVIALRFMVSDLTFLQRGVAFIALGVALIALNTYLRLRAHRLRKGESS